METKQPQLTFACELSADELARLFLGKELIPMLQGLGARVSLGILDFSDQRVEITRQLTKEGIPVIAWLLLPHQDGYWFNLDNAQKAAIYYGQFKQWTKANDLCWAAIGLDIEPDIQLIQGMRDKRWQMLRRLVKSGSRKAQRRAAILDYRSLVIQMRVDGYRIESYQYPIIVDERKVGSSVLQQFAGIVDISSDLEVLMLYSSFTRGAGAGILTEYGGEAQSIGIGSTGGGVDLDGVLDAAPLTWNELERDLLLAKQFTDEIFIFSLEGCYHHGYLESIQNMNWDRKLTIQPDRRVMVARKGFQGVLWILARPWVWIAGFVIVLSLVLAKNRSHYAKPTEPKTLSQTKSKERSHQKIKKIPGDTDKLSAKIKDQLIHAALEIISKMLTRATRKG